MPLAYYGNGSGDWSSTFASLADGVIAESERLGARLDQRREDELAAKDTEAFARYQAGQMSDDEWLAYIRNRKNQTSYDPTQQANWRKAELEWGERIADDKAQAAFERTGDYGDYIGYLEGKLKGTKDSDGRLELTKQIRDLRDAMAQRNYARGEQRLLNDVKLGRATQQDLLRFYRDQRASLRSNSPLRETVNGAIANTQAAIKQERFETGWGEVDVKFRSGLLTPAEAARQKRDLLRASGLQNTDPSGYASLLDETRKLEHTPDPKALSRLMFDLTQENITPAEYERRVFAMADLLADYDSDAAWTLRTQASDTADQYQAQIDRNKLPNPGALLGNVAPGQGTGGMRWISQMDGSQYAATNCTMASGAMLAYAMGYKGLSGGDLRFLTGDTVGGTNLDQMMFALQKAGVDTSGMSQMTGASFDRLRKAVGNGRPAVLMGSNANLPVAARAAAGQTGRHALLIAEYDEGKDAFLVFNSAVGRGDKRSKDGYWVSADAIENFGWGGGLSVGGQFVLSPKGTTDPGRRKAWHVIDVDTPPQRKGTPRTYVGKDNPGASGNQRSAARARGAIKDPYAATREDVANADAQAQAQMDRLKEVSDSYLAGNTEWNGIQLTPEVMDQFDAEALDLADERIAYAKSLDDDEQAGRMRDWKSTFIADAKERNGNDAEAMLNSMVRDAVDDITQLQNINDPAKRTQRIQSIAKRFRDFADRKSRVDESDPTSGIDPEAEARISGVADAIGQAADPNASQADKAKGLADLAAALGAKLTGDFMRETGLDPEASGRGDDLGKLISNVAGVTEDKFRLDNQTGSLILKDGVVTTAPNKPSVRFDPATGEQVEVQVPDTSNVGDGRPIEALPMVWIQTSDGPQLVPATVTQQTYANFLKANADYTGDGLNLKKGKVLTSDQIGAMSRSVRERLVNNGILVPDPWLVDTVTTPDAIVNGRRVSGQTWFHDPDRPAREGWFRTSLPITSNVVGDGGGVITFIGYDEKRGGPDINWQGGANGNEFIMSPEANRREVQRQMNDPNSLVQQYRVPAGERQYRDENGEISTDRADDDSHVVYDPVQAALNEVTSADDWAQWDAITWDRNAKRSAEAKAAAQQAMAAAQSAAGAANRWDPLDPFNTYSQRPQDAQPQGGAQAPSREPLGPPAPQPQPDILKRLADSFGVKRPHPTPSRGDIPSLTAKPRTAPPPATLPSKVPERKPTTTRRFVPPPPSPTVRAMQTAAANSAVAKAQAAAAKAAQASRSQGGGVLGPRRA